MLYPYWTPLFSGSCSAECFNRVEAGLILTLHVRCCGEIGSRLLNDAPLVFWYVCMNIIYIYLYIYICTYVGLCRYT